jgi:hypothetical protein
MVAAEFAKEAPMAVGQIGPNAIGSAATGGAGQPAAPARTEAKPRQRVAGVTVTLSPEARQHLSRMEGFTATIGTSKQPKQMAKPGLNIDIRT